MLLSTHKHIWVDKMKNSIKSQSLIISALVVLGMLSGADNALAQKTFNDVGENIIGGIAELPGLITGISYMLGILLGVLGILKIKDHVENPGQTPLQHGMIRLASGGALFALPIITESMSTLIDTQGAATGAVTPTVANIEYN